MPPCETGDQQLVLVKILVTTPCPYDPEREETSWFQFYDLLPDMPASVQVIETYQEVEDAEIVVWNLDVDEKQKMVATLETTAGIH